MAVSSGSVVHYTRSLEILKTILKEKQLRLKFCSEKVNIINGKEKGTFDIAVPIVSFCDIPFTEIETHSKAYGNYGLGLSKLWATRRCLNPVIYLADNSHLAGIMDVIYLISAQLNRDVTNETEDHDIHRYKNLDRYTREMLGYIKNYSGDILERGLRDYCFYNEREWRFLAREDQNVEKLLAGDVYRNNKDLYNEKAKQFFVEFDASDITYLVLNDTNDISELVDFFESENIMDSKTLLGRIITLRQIKEDF